jgi:hypothetical protein
LRKTLMTALKQIQTMDCRIYNLNLWLLLRGIE